MEFGFPQNGAVEDCNEKASTAAGTVRILGILMTIQASEVSIRAAGHTRIITGGHEETPIHGSLEIMAYADESQFMTEVGQKVYQAHL